MFGRIRSSSSSSLESLERPPPKLLKDDSLSIYEATLMKLKRGSKCKLSSVSMQLVDDKENGVTQIVTSTDPMKMDTNGSISSSGNDEAMAINTDSYSPRKPAGFGEAHSASGSEEKEERSVSILYMFSKFKNAHQHAVSSSSIDSIKTMESDCYVSASPSFSNCGTLNRTEKSEQEYMTSLPVSNL